jgi:stress response protein YsnF
MAERTLTAMYDTRGAAESARDDLVALGISAGNVTIRGTESGSSTSSTSSTTEDKGFLDNLADFFFPEEDQQTYAEGIRRGGYLLSARVPDALEDQAADVLERYDPVDVDERAESWRQSGWAGYPASGAGAAGATTTPSQAYTEGSSLALDNEPNAARGTGYQAGGVGAAGSTTAAYGESTSTSSRDYGTAGSGRSVGDRASDAVSDAAEAVGLKSDNRDEQRRGYGTADVSGTSGTAGSGLGAATVRTGRDEDVVERVEEDLQVGKREVGRGRVRVRSYVTERPVEEQVSLREERVQVERRPVDRPVQPGDATFQEKEITATERGEEAVVSKEARVVEEIGIRKDVDTRTETVRDTVRQQEVEVEDDRTAGRTLTSDEEPLTTGTTRDRRVD